jgi:hypothetical protein
MPRPNKRKKQFAAVQDDIGKRRWAWNEDSSPIEAIFGPDTISSLRGKKRTPIAASIAEAGINTALPDVATSLPTPFSAAVAEADTNAALPDVATSLPPADFDLNDDANATNDSVTDTQSNNHPRATDLSTSAQEIKLEPVPVVKTEAAPAPANSSSTDQAEAFIPTEPVINGPNLDRTVTVRRKAAKRTDPLYLAPPPQNFAVPLSPSPQAEEIPARTKPCFEEPCRSSCCMIPTSGTATAAPTPTSTATVEIRQFRRQAQLPSTSETCDEQLDDVENDDDPISPPDATVNTPIRRRSSRRVIPTNNTGTPVPHPTVTVDASNLRRSRRQRQIQLPPFEPTTNRTEWGRA